MKNEDYVSWSDALSLGIEGIDAQHQTLITLINDIWHGLVSHHPAVAVEGIVARLEEYTQTHFKDEEAMLEHCGYPGLPSHRESHAYFVSRVAELRARVVEGQAVGLDILQFLSDWLKFHISIVDRQYAEYIRAKETESVSGS